MSPNKNTGPGQSASGQRTNARSSPKSRPQDVFADLERIYSPNHNNPHLLDITEGFCSTLSSQLNSTQVHFINELVQNADDNPYAAGINPELTLKLDKDGIRLTNNEEGFTEQHVRAICSAHHSSKNKALGHTGEKGFGFKSVFAVANKVYIHSNEYCFMFDSQGPMGYLRPIQLEQAHFPVDVQPTGTTMYLKFKPGFDHQNLQHELTILRPYFMVFLNQLKCLDLELPDTTLRYSITPGADPKASDVVQLKQTNVSGMQQQPPAPFLLVSANVTVPEDFDKKARPGLTTKVAVAFALGPEQQHANPLADAQAFATLPIMPSGFRFLIQADFIVSLNRESILMQSPEAAAWNVFLREKLALLLLDQALPRLQAHASLNHSLLSYMPLQGEVSASGFFVPLAEELMEGLKGRQCVMNASGAWVTPREIVIANHEWTQACGRQPLITNVMLNKLPALKKQYPNRAFMTSNQARRAVQVLKQLGAETFSGVHLTAFLCHENAGNVIRTNVEQLAPWLLSLYRRLAAYDASNKQPELNWGRLRAYAAIFKEQSGWALVPAAGLMIWNHNVFSESDRCLFLRRRFLDDGTWDSSVTHLLSNRFGVGMADVPELAQYLLSLRSGDTCSEDELVGHIHFIHRHNYTLTPVERTQLQLRCACGCTRPCSCKAIHRPARTLFLPLDPSEQHLAHDLTAAGIHFLHPSYFLDQTSAGSLRMFLSSRCGVQDLTRDTICMQLLSGYRNSPAPAVERNLQHLRFMLQHVSLFSDSVRQRLPASCLVLGDCGWYMAGNALYLPLPDGSDKARVGWDLEQAGIMRFCNADAYQDAWATQPMLMGFMQQCLGVREASPEAMVCALAQLHGVASSHLSSLQLENHLQYVLRHRQQLLGSAAGLAAARQVLVRTAGDGPPLPAGYPLCLPLDNQFWEVEEDLRRAGMQFVHPEVQRLFIDVPAVEVDRLLAIRSPDVRDVLSKLATLYSHGTAVVCSTRTRAHLLMLLRFLHEHAQAILDDPQLHETVRTHVFLRIAGSSNVLSGDGEDSSNYRQAAVVRLLAVGSPAAVSLLLQEAGVFVVDDENLQLHTLSNHSAMTSRAFLIEVLGVQHYTEHDIAQLYLDWCQQDPMHLQQLLSDEDMLQMAQYVMAAAADEPNLYHRALQWVPLRVTSRAVGETHFPPLRTSSPGTAGDSVAGSRHYNVPVRTYVQSLGQGWTLQHVLHEQNAYLHPTWVAAAPSLVAHVHQAPTPVLEANGYHLGPELSWLISIDKEARNMAFLCMLRDILHPQAPNNLTRATQAWRAFFTSGAASQAVCHSLGSLTVRVTVGKSRPLRDCFVRSDALVLLLGPSAPFVDVPEGDAGDWGFLTQLGAQSDADVGTLLKRLDQIRVTGGSIDIAQVSTLYQHLGSHGANSPASKQAIVNAFTSMARLYLPPGCRQSELYHAGAWVPVMIGREGSNFLRWASRHKPLLMHGKVLLASVYPACQTLLKDCLGIKDSGDEDLADGLRSLVSESRHKPQPLFTHSPEGKARVEQVLAMYRALAEVLDSAKPIEPPWLIKIMRSDILLVSAATPIPDKPLLFFTNSRQNDNAVYMADDPELANMFQSTSRVQILAVPASELPALRQLLQLCGGALAPLSVAVERSVQSASGRVEWREWSDRLRLVAGWVARAAYQMEPALFTAGRLRDGRLVQLCGDTLTVYQAEGIMETFALGNHRMQNRRAQVAVDTQGPGIALLLDSAHQHKTKELVIETLAPAYAGLWLTATPLLAVVVDKLLTMIVHNRADEVDQWMNANRMYPLSPAMRMALGLDQTPPPPPTPPPAPVQQPSTPPLHSSLLPLRQPQPSQPPILLSFNQPQLSQPPRAPLLHSHLLPLSQLQASQPPSLRTQPSWQTRTESVVSTQPSQLHTPAAARNNFPATVETWMREGVQAGAGSELLQPGAAVGYSGHSQGDAASSRAPATQAPDSIAESADDGYFGSNSFSPSLRPNGGKTLSWGLVHQAGARKKSQPLPGTTATGPSGGDLCMAGLGTREAGAGREGAADLGPASGSNGNSQQPTVATELPGGEEANAVQLVVERADSFTWEELDWSAASRLSVGDLQQLATSCGSPSQRLSAPLAGIGAQLKVADALPLTPQARPCGLSPLSSPRGTPFASQKGPTGTQPNGTTGVPHWPCGTSMGPPVGSERLLEIGLVGELFVLDSLKALFGPSCFNENNWVSGLRACVGLPAPAVEPRFDFWMDDPHGHLTGVPNSIALIEVKSTTADGSNGFAISSGEFNLAMQLSQHQAAATQPAACMSPLEAEAAGLPALAGRQLVYVIVRVGRIPQSVITHVMRDPGGMYLRGKLQLASTDNLTLHSFHAASTVL